MEIEKKYNNSLEFVDEACILELPFPPTINHYWGIKTIIKGRKSIPIKYLTKEAREFRRQVKFAVMEHESFIRKTNKSFKGFYFDIPIYIEVHYYPLNKRKHDIDNPTKPLFDALQHCELIKDDCLIKKCYLHMHEELLNKTIISIHKLNNIVGGTQYDENF